MLESLESLRIKCAYLVYFSLLPPNIIKVIAKQNIKSQIRAARLIEKKPKSRYALVWSSNLRGFNLIKYVRCVSFTRRQLMIWYFLCQSLQ